jgi:hypothetical protein
MRDELTDRYGGVQHHNLVSSGPARGFADRYAK